jgi:hypothetical protein
MACRLFDPIKRFHVALVMLDEHASTRIKIVILWQSKRGSGNYCGAVRRRMCMDFDNLTIGKILQLNHIVLSSTFRGDNTF